MDLETKLIRTDGGTQARAALNAETVSDYRETLRESDATWPFPPVVVFHDGSEYWLADGFHRIAAAKQHGRFVVDADVRQGTQRDAVLFAAGANDAHGLRRTPDDKRRAVLRLLEDEEWGQWSDREIARRCNVSHPFVSSLRAATGNVTSERVYTNKHGETAVMQTAAIGNGSHNETDGDRRTNAYNWLLAYKDDKGRTWRDLEDNQVIHANSPCYQAYVRAFPGQVDPKFYLKQALYRLRSEGKEEETAVSQSPYYVGPNAQSDVIREALNRYLDQWPANRNFILRRLSNREASGHELAMAEASAALEAGPVAIWHQAMVLGHREPESVEGAVKKGGMAETAVSQEPADSEDTSALGAIRVLRDRGFEIVHAGHAENPGAHHNDLRVWRVAGMGLRSKNQLWEIVNLNRYPETAVADEPVKPPDETMVLLKKAEKSLGLAVATFNVATHKELFFKANNAYNILLNVIHEYR